MTSHDRVPAAIRCPHCDDTGNVHRADGEWLGTCACQSAPPTEPYLIWWTNQADCERIVPLDSWPTYLYDEYQSRVGRNGRGRLWVPRFLKAAPDGVSVPWNKANNWLCAAASDAAGIVIKAEHVEHVQFLPGFVTTFAMTCPSSHDATLLDTLRDESWDLRCFDMPTGQGDADIGWRVVGHWQADPRERTVGEAFHNDPRAAIRDAIDKTSAAPYVAPSGNGPTQFILDQDSEKAARKEAVRLLAAEDARMTKLHEILETIREQIRTGVEPEHRPNGLFQNIQDAVYTMRGRTPLMNDAAITSALSSKDGGSCG